MAASVFQIIEQNLPEHIFNIILCSMLSTYGAQLPLAVIRAKSLVELGRKKKGFRKLCEQRQHLQLHVLD